MIPKKPFNTRVWNYMGSTLCEFAEVISPCINAGGVPPILDVTSAELYTKIVNLQLVQGQQYRITDYRSTNYLNGWQLANQNPTPIDPFFNPRQVHYGEIEPLIVTAISSFQLSPFATSLTYPNDIIEYEAYANKIGLDYYISNGGTLPNGNPVTGLDLKWDGTNVYFDMPAGYPALFGHYFYIYAGFSGNTYSQDGTFDPLTPVISTAQYPYSNDYDYPKKLSRLAVSANGMKVTLIDLDYNDYLNYDADSLQVGTVYAFADAYGCITRRHDTERNINVPFDFRGIKYRRYEVDLSSDTYFYSPVYAGIGDNPLIYNAPRPTTGNYRDVYTLGNNSDSDVLSVYLSGTGSLDGPYYYRGNWENNVFMKGARNINMNFDAGYSYNNTFINNVDSLHVAGGYFNNNIFSYLLYSYIEGYVYANVIVLAQYLNFTGGQFAGNAIETIDNLTVKKTLAFNKIQYLVNSSGFIIEGNSFPTCDIYSCNLGPNFTNNISTLTSTFRDNDNLTDLTGVDFTAASHVYIGYTCTFIMSSVAGVKLTYFDGTTQLYVAPNA